MAVVLSLLAFSGIAAAQTQFANYPIEVG
jgi:hypothetical protein